MVTPAVDSIDLFKIAGCSISGWVPSFNRNLAKAEAARRLAQIQQGVFWIGTEATLTIQRHYNLAYVHARRKDFPAFADIATALRDVWPAGEVASVEEIESRLIGQWSANLVAIPFLSKKR